MSWLRALEIGLDIANVAVNVSNSAQLSELRRMGASSERRIRVAAELRNQVFNFRQAADAALSSESDSVFRTAIAMRLLEQRLLDSKISPNDFDNFSDKEYVHSVVRHIQDSAQRLYDACSPFEQQEIPNLVNTILRLPDYKYFIEKHADYTELKRAKKVVDQLSDRNSSGTGFGLGWLKVGSAIYLGFYAYLSQSVFTGILMLAIWIAGYIGLSKWQNSDKYKSANLTYTTLNSRMNANQMASLEREFGSLERVQLLHEDAERSLRTIFGSALTPQLAD